MSYLYSWIINCPGVFCMLSVLRSMFGLVGSRSLVAGQELVVAQDTFDAGPVRRTGGRQARLHDNAQERASAAARPAGRRRPHQLCLRRLRRRRQTL